MRVRLDSISLERLDGETIAINFDTGQYFSMRGPASDVVWFIERGVDRSDWMGILGDTFDSLPQAAVLQGQLDAFIQELLEAGIVDDVDSDGPANVVTALPDDYERGIWERPLLSAHEDLVDLLVIDPIHEAGDDGWPSARTP
jgi:hypothetical protein